jgi:hypothetical protein
MAGALDKFRGTLRFGPMTAPPKVAKGGAKEFQASADKARSDEEPGWLQQSRKLIPGEALAGYLSLQALANPKIASNPQNIRIILALVFAVVTILLRWLGSQDPNAPKPSKTVEWSVVALSTLSYVCLVYSTGGQIFWHAHVEDQELYAQIFAVALGILGPAIIKALDGKPRRGQAR